LAKSTETTTNSGNFYCKDGTNLHLIYKYFSKLILPFLKSWIKTCNA
jgi:hypothetical protein